MPKSLFDTEFRFEKGESSLSVRPKKASKNRGQQRIAMTRKKLKDAALDVFSEKSVDAATVEDITEKADLGKGTLYRHFVDKEEVVLVLVEDAIEHLIERIRSYPEESYLCYLKEIENQVSHYVSSKIDTAKIHRLACAVAGFISGYFSFAMIGMDEDEIETSIKPLKKAFVRSLCVFLGRE